MKPDNDPLECSESPTVSWAMLLARWTEFARSAVAIPPDGDGLRWRATVAPAIGLQAVTLAVGDIERLSERDRPLALDMAHVLVRRYALDLNEAWRGVEMPEKLTALLADARDAVALAAAEGEQWTISGPAIVAPRLDAWAQDLVNAGFEGEALAAQPGTILFTGEPLLFLRSPSSLSADQWPSVAGALASSRSVPRQIYRQWGEAGTDAHRDLIVPFEGELHPGRPLLLPLIEAGRVVPQHDDEAAARWEAAQRSVLGAGLPEVVFG